MNPETIFTIIGIFTCLYFAACMICIARDEAGKCAHQLKLSRCGGRRRNRTPMATYKRDRR